MKIWTHGSSLFKWVPKCLNTDEKHKWCQLCEHLLEFVLAMCNPNHFLSQLVTVDKTWLYQYDLETTQQSVEWQHTGSPCPAPKNSKYKNLLENLPRFFGIKTVLKGQTINAEYYSSLLVQLKDILKEKCCRKFTKGVLFLHDNALAHWAFATQKKLAYLGFQCLDRPPYSLDLAASEYHLFPGLKKQFKGCHFLSDTDLVGQTTFQIFLSGLQKLEQQAKKCTVLRGEYVE